MAKIYAELIRKGMKTLNDVPERLKEEVKRLLKEGVWCLTMKKFLNS